MLWSSASMFLFAATTVASSLLTPNPKTLPTSRRPHTGCWRELFRRVDSWCKSLLLTFCILHLTRGHASRWANLTKEVWEREAWRMDVQGRNDPPRVPCITSRDFHKQISLKTIYLHKNFAACREFATVNLLSPRNLLCFTHYMNLLHKRDTGSGKDILSSIIKTFYHPQSVFLWRLSS